MGDWDHPYLTMAFPPRRRSPARLMKFAETGQLYRGSKPVMWSVVEKTALAEAEVEYEEHKSDTVFVAFPVRGCSPASGDRHADVAGRLRVAWSSVVIWTTTPWTIPGNRAISFHHKSPTGSIEVTAAPDDNWAKPARPIVLADKLAEERLQGGQGRGLRAGRGRRRRHSPA